MSSLWYDYGSTAYAYCNSFHTFWNHIDSFPQEAFLYFTSGGIPVAKLPPTARGPANASKKDQQAEREVLEEVEGEPEDEVPPENGEEG